MSLNTWRQFNFFDLSPIKDPSSPDEGLLYADPNLSAICRGRDDTAFMATSDGRVKEFTVDMQVRISFTAYDETWTITTIRFLVGTSLLLTLAEKQGEAAKLHLWDLNKQDKGAPRCHTTVNISNGSNTFPLSAFALNYDFSILGVGYTDGTVIIARGDIIHDRGSRQRVVYNSTSPITGLEFVEANGVSTLYVTTINQVFTVPTHGRNPGKAEAVLDKAQGCAVKCETLDSTSLVVAREDSITYYSTKMRGSSFVFDVPKKSIFLYKHYLVITTYGSLGSQNALTNLIDSSTTRVIIIDTIHKYVAFSGQISNGVRDIFEQWGRVNILGVDGVLYAITERDLESRLKILKQRHLYSLALEVAGNEGHSVTDIEYDFADYLYSEGELGQAISHYIEAIDSGRTSQVILKYRDSQHIGYLTEYLEVLHNRELATKEHTTLLMNSYAKMQNVEKLAKFIEQSAGESQFDFETAIKICRQSGYYSLAAYLAQKFGDPDLAVLIYLRDLHDYKACLYYIQGLNYNDALRVLNQHARTLLDEHPTETTSLLISLFTGKFAPKREDTAPTPTYRTFVNYMSAGLATPSTPSEPSEPAYQPPKPRLIFSSFIDHPKEFVHFLEACLESYDQFEGDEKNRIDLEGTLFEMYLNLASRSQNEAEKREWQRKARETGLKSNISQNNLLLLSHMASFNDGELMAKTQAGYQDMFRAAAAVGDVTEAEAILHKFGDKEKELYPLALKFYTSSKRILDQVGEQEFMFVLDKIKKEKLMAPLQVIQALSVNSVATVGHIRQYLIDLITNERTEIEHNQTLAESYRSETQTKQKEVAKMLHDPQVIQYTLCSSCRTSLDLPAVHFACRHSYHQRCINDYTEHPSCPQCQPDLENIKAVRQAQDDLAERHDLFQTSLKESGQKFKTMTDFLGRGALSY